GRDAISVLRARPRSWRAYSTPSRLGTRSGSSASAPCAMASAKASSVCSGRRPLAPRWAMMRGAAPLSVLHAGPARADAGVGKLPGRCGGSRIRMLQIAYSQDEDATMLARMNRHLARMLAALALAAAVAPLAAADSKDFEDSVGAAWVKAAKANDLE